MDAEELNPEPMNTSLVINALKPPIEKPSSANLYAMPRIKALVVPSSSFFDIKSFSFTINGLSYPSENIVTTFLSFRLHTAIESMLTLAASTSPWL